MRTKKDSSHGITKHYYYNAHPRAAALTLDKTPSRPTPRHRRSGYSASSPNIHQPIHNPALGLPHRHPAVQILGRVQTAETRGRAASGEDVHGGSLGRSGCSHQCGGDLAQGLSTAGADQRRCLGDSAIGVRRYGRTRVVDGGRGVGAELGGFGLRGAGGGCGGDDVGDVGLSGAPDGADDVGDDVGDADGDADGCCGHGFGGDEAVDGGVVRSCVSYC